MNRYVYKIAYVITEKKCIFTDDSRKCCMFVSKKITERKALKRAIKFIRNFINNNNTKDGCAYVELCVLNKKSRRPVYLQDSWGKLSNFSDSAIEAILKDVLRRYCE